MKLEIRLESLLRKQWQLTIGPALKPKVNRLLREVTRQLNEWRNDQCSATFESLDPEGYSLCRMNKRVMRIPWEY
jgi:hypothetical protein